MEADTGTRGSYWRSKTGPLGQRQWAGPGPAHGLPHLKSSSRNPGSWCYPRALSMLGTQAPGKPSCSNPAKRPHPFETSNNSTQACIPPHLPGPMKRVIHTLPSPRKRGHIANDQLWSHVQGAGAWVSSKGAEWRGYRHSGFTRELALPLTPSVAHISKYVIQPHGLQGDCWT